MDLKTYSFLFEIIKEEIIYDPQVELMVWPLAVDLAFL